MSLLDYKYLEEILAFSSFEGTKVRSERHCDIFLNKTKCYLYQMLSEISQILYGL